MADERIAEITARRADGYGFSGRDTLANVPMFADIDYLLARVKALTIGLETCVEAADALLSDPGVTFDEMVDTAKYIYSKAKKAVQDGE